MGRTEIDITLTTGTEPPFGSGPYAINYEAYVGTFPAIGNHVFSSRSSPGQPWLPSSKSLDTRGKPKKLLRGTVDYRPAHVALPVAVYGGIISDNLGPKVKPASQRGKIVSGFPEDEYQAIASHVSFGDLSSVYAINSYEAEATHHYLQIPEADSELVYTDYEGDYLTDEMWFDHAFKISAGSDFPTWFDATPTHVVVRGGTSLGWHVPLPPQSGWEVNPGDMTNARSPRVIGGEYCSCGYGGLTPSGPNAYGPLVYSRHDANALYIGGSHSFPASGWDNDVMLISLQEDISGDLIYVSAALSLMRQLPLVDLRAVSFLSLDSDTDIIIYAEFLPFFTSAELVIDTLDASSGLDYVKYGVSLAGLTIPDHATSVLLRVATRDSGGGIYFTNVNIVAPQKMTGANASQTTLWSDVVPAYVRRLDL